MDQVLELLRAYEKAPTLAEAERALSGLGERGVPQSVRLGDLYDELAMLAAEEDDFELAVRAQRRACEIGCEFHEQAREMLGWYLLKAGNTAAGEALFAELRDERGAGDIELLILIGSARLDSGFGEAALEAFDEGLDAARLVDDRELLDWLRAERRECRRELGLSADRDDKAAHKPALGIDQPRDTAEQTQWILGWFPRDQRDAAVERWPDLEGDLRDPDAYCTRMEQELREIQHGTGRAPLVAPITVDRLLDFARREGLDPGEAEARSRFAAEAGRTGAALSWPPGRNQRCWCGSGEKYKRCCGAR